MKTKKFISFLIAILLCFNIVACQRPQDPNATVNETDGSVNSDNFHIGVMTGTASQSEDELRGAEAMLEKYGDAKDGGMMVLKTYPDNFMSEQETTIQQIVGFADDPLMKVIIVQQAVPGTAAAFKQVKEKRPDILCFAAATQEDPNVICEAADLVVAIDQVTRGYIIPHVVKEMGATKFVHVSFPRHLSDELISLRKDVLEATCAELGIEFYSETSPDPLSDVGVPGSQNFILEQMPAWVEKYGKDTNFFTTNTAQMEPMIKRAVDLGAMFVEETSPISGYPGALGLDLSKEAGDWEAILKKEEEDIVAKGASGRIGTWAYSFGYSGVTALVELGKQVVEGTADYKNLDDISEAFASSTGGAQWKSRWYTDRATKEERDNFAMVLQDTYVFGKGYMHGTDLEVPDLYKLIDDYQAKK